jgi:tetrahydromethanopterin S-methyltransferase subunit G
MVIIGIGFAIVIGLLICLVNNTAEIIKELRQINAKTKG